MDQDVVAWVTRSGKVVTWKDLAYQLAKPMTDGRTVADNAGLSLLAHQVVDQVEKSSATP